MPLLLESILNTRTLFLSLFVSRIAKVVLNDFCKLIIHRKEWICNFYYILEFYMNFFNISGGSFTLEEGENSFLRRPKFVTWSRGFVKFLSICFFRLKFVWRNPLSFWRIELFVVFWICWNWKPDFWSGKPCFEDPISGFVFDFKEDLLVLWRYIFDFVLFWFCCFCFWTLPKCYPSTKCITLAIALWDNVLSRSKRSIACFSCSAWVMYSKTIVIGVSKCLFWGYFHSFYTWWIISFKICTAILGRSERRFTCASRDIFLTCCTLCF